MVFLPFPTPSFPPPPPPPPSPPLVRMAAARVGAPAALPVSDQPQGTVGVAWGSPFLGSGHPHLAGKVCGREAQGPRVAGISRARWVPSAGAPSPSLRPCRPQRCPRGPGPGFLSAPLPCGRWDQGPGLKRDRKLKQQRKEPRQASEGGGRGLAQTRARSGPPRPESTSLGGSGFPPPPDSHLPRSWLGSSRCCPSPAPSLRGSGPPASGHSWCLHRGCSL